MPPLSMFQSTPQTGPAPASTRSSIDEARVMMDHAGHLLTDTAHDLRSPLSAARELVQLVADGFEGPVSEQQKSHLQTVVDRCNEMQRLIDDMLHYECMRTGTPKLRKTWLALNRMPSMVQPTVQSKCDSRALQLQWIGFEPTLPSVFADADKLRRLLVNLIDNAIGVTPEGGSIVVRTEIATGGDRIRLSVTDSGQGMTLDKLKQLSVRGITSEHGYGLGLSICRQIAALHYSQMTVSSAVDQGTCFSVELATGGIAAVLDHFSRWREQILPSQASANEPHIGPPPRKQRKRSIATQRETVWNEVVLSVAGDPPQNARATTLVAANAIAPIDAATAVTYDNFMQGQCGMHELVYQVQRGQWVMAMDCSRTQARKRIQAIESARVCQSELALVNNPLQWAGPINLAIGSARDRQKLHDAFVRESVGMPVLSSQKVRASQDEMDNPGEGWDKGELAEAGQNAQRRLDNEVRWLMQRFQDSQKQLSKQTQMLRHEY